MVNRIPRWLAVGTALLVGVSMQPAPAHSEGKPWVMASLAPEGSPYFEASDAIARVFEREVPGLRIQRRYAGVVGDEADSLRLVQRGRVALVTVSLGALVDLVPELGVLELPFLFEGNAALGATVRAMESGQRSELQAPVAKSGLVLVALRGVGWRNLASLGPPIRRASDLRGRRVRTQPLEIHRATWRALGATPVDAPLNGLLDHVRARQIEVVDIPLTFLFGTSVHEQVRSVTLTQHVPQFIALVASREAWAALGERQRARVRAGVGRVAAATEARMAAFDEELLGLLEQRGVTVVRPRADELATFRAARASLDASLRPITAPQRALLSLVRAGEPRPR